MMKTIAHIDLNAFFVQVEMNRHPELKNKPIAVGSHIGHGVIATSNYLARKYNVKSGMASSIALANCPDLVILPGDYSEYSRVSKLFFDEVRKIFPIIEMASIDECYLDCSKLLNGLDRKQIYDFMFDFQIRLFKSTNLKCSIGVGKNKFLAKMGSDYKKPLGLTLILDEIDLENIIWSSKIESMYGIGSKTYPRLKDVGINTIGDLAKSSPKALKHILGKYAEYLINEAKGIGDDYVNTSTFDPKSSSCDYTFLSDTNDYEEIKAQLIACANEVSKSLISENKITKTICLKIRYSDFVTITKRNTFDKYSSKVDDIIYWTLKIFEDFYNGEMIRLIGCSAQNCIDNNSKKINN